MGLACLAGSGDNRWWGEQMEDRRDCILEKGGGWGRKSELPSEGSLVSLFKRTSDCIFR
jgi:hypothetical protein